MNKCKYCNQEFKNPGALGSHKKYCHLNPKNIKYCELCGEILKDTNRTYCSYTCSHKDRRHTEETKRKISKACQQVPHKKKRISLKCKNCGENYQKKSSLASDSKFCSRSCSTKWRNKHNNLASRAGKKAAKVNKQTKRSKNEKRFAKLCKKKFKSIKTNENIFNGWDADVIIKDIKVAVLWNGKWHYKKIMESHSVKQVQNRDHIKRKEIRKSEYLPYTIVDMGKHDKQLVKRQFKLFLKTLKNCGVV